MRNVSDIIEALGGTQAVATGLGLAYAARVSDWKRRQVIPSEHWDGLILLAAEKGVEGVNYGRLQAIRNAGLKRRTRVAA